MGMAGGILMNALAGIPYELGMTAILFVCVVYTLFGGLFAVIGTDFIQSVIILIGIVVVGFGIFSSFDFDRTYADIMTERPMLISVLLPAAIMAIFNNLLFGIGEIFHSNVWWSRAFAMRKGIGQKAYLLGGLFWLPVPVAAGFIALAGGTIGINVTSPDMIGPMVAASILGKVGAIVVFAVLFCSLASSIDSLLAATSDLITEDVYRRLIRKDANEAQMRRMSAAVIVGLGILTWLVCMPRIGTLATVLFFAGPMVGSTIWPIATGLFWRKSNSRGAFWAMVLGSCAGLVAYFQIGWYSASLIGAAVSMLVVLFSRVVAPEDFDWHRLDEKGIAKGKVSA
jgi:Na+/proline symporter